MNENEENPADSQRIK